MAIRLPDPTAAKPRTLTAEHATNVILSALEARADYYRGRYVGAACGLTAGLTANGEPDWLDTARIIQAVANAFRTGDLFLDGKVEVVA